MTPKASVLAPEVETTQQQGGAEIAISLLEALFGDRMDLCEAYWVNRRTHQRQPCDEIASHVVMCPSCSFSRQICARHVAGYSRQPLLEVVCAHCAYRAPRLDFPISPIGGTK